MSFKIPCGGFRLDEKSFSLDENGVLSIPKPLTYDYMPEGYPKKDIEYVTLMEEQEVTFSDMGRGDFGAASPVALEINKGDKLTVVWDAVSYDVEVTKSTYGPGDMLVFGNAGLALPEDTTDYPFMYTESAEAGASQWFTADTATTHTIKVMRQQETITPMSTDFLPVVDGVIISSSTADSTKKFKITVDDSGTISATEVT